ncbi:Major facilitator superfamily domain, general substrate transporter [Metarhizium album ARSEF 1941]|uniref:Autophagy-related protein n=1 Tax=Metarhizium album (strain ARSEF 1941) TaxID=1081103 RepID=A0A0B2X2T3_METAS|nr:Major facilitator superfamily domain, general substrate transporter [Metarhizium album ARSEF 1941]KHN99595.1 Major facilitator superfamily domain, general substrate transporter [Metarhizium album ARSEF 1941]
MATSRRGGTKMTGDNPSIVALTSADDEEPDLSATESTQERRQVVLPPLQSGEIPATTKYEMLGWFSYYAGCNGIGGYNFAPSAFQNLLSQAAGGSKLYFAGRERDVNSIVLLCNGISFAIQIVLFVVIGAYADFGTGRRWVLLTWSIIAYGVGFGWIAVHDSERWKAGAALYMVGLISYQVTTTYWAAAFPALARNTEHLRDSQAGYKNGEISLQELRRRDDLERSRLSNVALWIQSIVEVFILAVIIGVMFGLDVNGSEAKNNWGLSVLIALSTAFWLVLSIPWFLLEQTRPGLRTPPGKSALAVGFWQLHTACRQVWKLRQSLIFLVGYFFLGDSLTTSVTVVLTLQNQVVSYNTLTLTYLLLVNVVCQVVGVGAYWTIQKRLRLTVKPMLNAITVFAVLLATWGMAGNWTQRFGFHTVWEVWAFQVFLGLFISPWYSYAQIAISSVTPRGHEFLFFSIFNIVGKASSVVGPLISSAIIDATPGGSNTSAPFYFLFALSLVSAVGIWRFLDLEESAREQERFLADENARAEGAANVAGANGMVRRLAC